MVFMGDGSLLDGCVDYELFIVEFDLMWDISEGGSEFVGLFYIGGIIGWLKGVMLSYDNFVFNVFNVVLEMDYGFGMIYMYVVLMFYLVDMVSIFVVMLVGGMYGIVFCFDIDDVFFFIECERVIYVLFVLMMINLLVFFGRIKEFDVSSVKCMFYGVLVMFELVLISVMK